MYHQEEPKNDTVKLRNTFFDFLQGNQFSHGNRLLHWSSNQTAANLIDHEMSLDYFIGFLGGEFPYHSKELYHSDVLSAKLQTTVNITARYKVQIMNFTQLEWEVNFVPLLFNLGVDSYSTSLIGDNCFWFYYQVDTMMVDTTFTKHVKECSFNVKTFVEEADSYSDIITNFMEHPNQVTCEYNPLYGPNR